MSLQCQTSGREIAWLRPFEQAGKSVVDLTVTSLCKVIKPQKPFSARGKLLLALIAAAICRVILTTIINLF
jgi:hypothetical protein